MIMIKMKMMTFRLSDTVSEAGDRLSARHSHRGDDHDDYVDHDDNVNHDSHDGHVDQDNLMTRPG